MAADDSMYQDRTAETSKYFERLQAYSTSQAAVATQSYGAQQGGTMPLDMSYRQRLKAISDNQYSSATGTDMTNYRRIAAREQEIYRDKLHSSISRYSAEAIPAMLMGPVSGLIAPYAMMSPLAKYHEQQQEFRFAGYRFANAIDTFANQTGTRNFSYAQSNALGNILRDRSFINQNSFFSGNDMVRMNQIGAANGLINVGNIAGGTSIENQTKEYVRQFDQLRKNTEMVVKTLKTTMEGGLKVIKDLKQMGVSDTQIQGFVGKMAGGAVASGMSYSGFQTLGGVGAQLAQQSGMHAMVGISGIQTAAMQLSQQNFYDPRMRNIINSVGGVANAAAMVSQANMSLLNTPVGTKMMAAMMNRDAATGVVSFDERAQDRLLAGKMSGYEITQRANAYGYRVGAAGRFMAKYDFQEAYQNLNAEQRDKMMRSYITAWGSSYLRQGGKREWAYGALESLGITDVNQVRLLAENYLRPTDVSLYRAADQYGALLSQDQGGYGRPKVGLFRGNLNSAMRGTTKALSAAIMGDSEPGGVGGVVGTPIALGFGLVRATKRTLSKAAAFIDSPAEWGTLGPDRSNMLSREEALERYTGLRRTTYGEQNYVVGLMAERSAAGRAARDIIMGKSTSAADAAWFAKNDPGAALKAQKMSTQQFNDIQSTFTRLLADRSTAVSNFRAMLGTNLRTSVSQEWANRSDAEILRMLEGGAAYYNNQADAINKIERKQFDLKQEDVLDEKTGKVIGKRSIKSRYEGWKSNDYRQRNLNRIAREKIKEKPWLSVEELTNEMYRESGKGGWAAGQKVYGGSWDDAKAASFSALGGEAGIASRKQSATDRNNYQAFYAARDAAEKNLENVLAGSGNKRVANQILSAMRRGDQDTADKAMAGLGLTGSAADKLSKAVEGLRDAAAKLSGSSTVQSFERQLNRRVNSDGKSSDVVAELKKFMAGEKYDLNKVNIGLKSLDIKQRIDDKTSKNADTMAAIRAEIFTATTAATTAGYNVRTTAGLISASGNKIHDDLTTSMAQYMGYTYDQAKGVFSKDNKQLTTDENIQVRDRVAKALKDATSMGGSFYENGKTTKLEDWLKDNTKEDYKSKVESMRWNALLSQLSQTQNNQGPASPSTGQMTPTVNSPILNYWNNNWSFSGK